MSIASEITRIEGAKTSLKNSINAKNDSSHQITTETIDDYYTFVNSISSGTDTEDATALASDIIYGKTAYARGSKITGTLETYTQLEYIESDRHQYIDTGVTPVSTQHFEITYSVSDVSTNQVLYGSRTSGAYNTSTNQLFCGNQVTYYYEYIGTYSPVNVNMNANTIYTRTLYANSGNLDNSATENIYLFALNNRQTMQGLAMMKLYSFKIYNNNVLVRDFIPAKRNYDNEIGLYDKITKEFFENEGSEPFTAGAEGMTFIKN